VVHSCASGFSTTWGISWSTYRATLLVPACVCVEAVVIHPAFYLDTRYVRVTFVPILAGTHWFVVDDSAESMIPASTWIFANFINAGITFSAFVIS